MNSKTSDVNWRTRHIDVRLGARLSALYGRRGYARAELARRLGVSDSALQHIEEGRTRLTASQLWQICGITGIPVGEVFAGLPNQVFKQRTDYEAAAGSTATAADEGSHPASRLQPGFAEERQTYDRDASETDDLVALENAARRLSKEQVAILLAAAKGWGV